MKIKYLANKGILSKQHNLRYLKSLIEVYRLRYWIYDSFEDNKNERPCSKAPLYIYIFWDLNFISEQKVTCVYIGLSMVQFTKPLGNMFESNQNLS